MKKIFTAVQLAAATLLFAVAVGYAIRSIAIQLPLTITLCMVGIASLTWWLLNCSWEEYRQARNDDKA